MSNADTDAVFAGFSRYLPWLLVGGVAVNLLAAWPRATKLIEAGRLTREEFVRFCIGAVALFGMLGVGLAVAQSLGETTDIRCLMQFPPRAAYGMVAWAAQGLCSGTILWWLWRGNGAVALAKIAPAFGRGDVLKPESAPGRVRLVVTALTLSPLVNIAFQLAGVESFVCRAP